MRGFYFKIAYIKVVFLRYECISHECRSRCIQGPELYAVWSRIVWRLLLKYYGNGCNNVPVHPVSAGLYVCDWVHCRGPQRTFPSTHIASQ